MPGSIGNVYLVGAYGNQLEVRTAFTCDEGSATTRPGESLAWFNPATEQVTVLLGPALKARGTKGGSVVGALAYQDDGSEAVVRQVSESCPC